GSGSNRRSAGAPPSSSDCRPPAEADVRPGRQLGPEFVDGELIAGDRPHLDDLVALDPEHDHEPDGEGAALPASLDVEEDHGETLSDEHVVDRGVEAIRVFANAREVVEDLAMAAEVAGVASATGRVPDHVLREEGRDGLYVARRDRFPGPAGDALPRVLGHVP